MKYKKSVIILLAVLLFMAVKAYQLFELDGARFSAIQAARVHFAVKGKNPQLFAKVDYPWGGVFLFHTDNGNRTVMAYKEKPSSWFYYARWATTFNQVQDQDGIKTIGWINGNTNIPGVQACVFAVEVSDPNIDSIEIGVGTDRINKKIIIGQPLVFSWSKAFIGAVLNPVALSKDGRVLYEYRYKVANVTNSDDLRWYSTKD
ncbi:hypothetical protein [Paenibacillus sp. Soil787]|uniref:hypothetical protein n=1 Tax=Paenibacillus sp. Soil787 TaxID=1736411 RepID=UPI0007023FBA|nr:hypothetical protein [Paenibacillus sp. Soil787]KRF20187.1 hypothetical protein ASG93_31230 [Paenibacillus sp. Soil787]